MTESLPEDVRRELDAIDAVLAGRPVEPELSELGRLALALRDERPEPRLGAFSSLDERVATGFPRRRRRFALPSIPPSALAGAAAAAIAIAVVIPLATSKHTPPNLVTATKAPEASSDTSSGASSSSSQASDQIAPSTAASGGA